MKKIIDTFLFFQELDLLEIRLDYLAPHVDCFVIIEACQTFSGKPKDFVFEKHSQRFSKYLHKIEYYKVTDFHSDFSSIQQYLNNAATPSHQKVLSILEQHTHYLKTELHWVLDCYHRECIHFVLDRIAGPDDVIILSDLDEIPSNNIFSAANLAAIREQPHVCQQREFRYFLNYFKDADWLGTIVGQQREIGQQSLNLLRLDSKRVRQIVHPVPIENGGYHFTSCGSIEMIREKIKSWGHQEFNNRWVLNSLEEKINSGQDIFHRECGTTLIRVDPNDLTYFDETMSKIICRQPSLLSVADINSVTPNLIGKLILHIKAITMKVIFRISRLAKML